MHVNPTPAHIRGAVENRVHEEAKARGEYVSQWVYDAIKRGISEACAEHDRATNRGLAA